MRHFVKLTLIFAFVSFLSGCSLFGENAEPEFSEAELWQGANTALEAENYEQAAQKLEALESRYPFGRYSEQAQLELIFVYHKQSKAAEAVAAADRFIRLHPQHENVDYAYYLRGLTQFLEDQSFLSRYLPTDMSMRDPGSARASFNDFSTLLQRYPSSQYAPDSRKRMVYLRNQLAAYEIHVARYYLRRGAFVAAANRGRYVIENYPKTQSVANALAVMISGYKALGLNDLAADSQTVLDDNFPDYPGLVIE